MCRRKYIPDSHQYERKLAGASKILKDLMIYMGFPCGSAGKESTCNAGDIGSIPGLGRSPGEGKSYPLQYSGEFSPEFSVHRVGKE